MFFSMQLTILVILAVVLPLAQCAPTCTNFTISVTTQPTQVKVPLPSLDLTTFIGNIDGFTTSIVNDLVGGNFNIAATYCEPEVKIASRTNTLQFLIHGATYTRNYWFGLYRGDRYSWVNTASLNGYPTIAIDRLGNGQSDHPDPTLDLQYPVQAACAHEIIQMARAGTGPFTRQFDNIIMTGHSYGSIIANAINFLYPQDADATILTGYSAYFTTAIPAALVGALPLPADLQDPRYSSLPALYFEFTSRSGFNSAFYGAAGTYDQSVQDYDWATRGTLGSGEAAAVAIGTNTAHGYTAPVYFMTAEQDEIFCNLVGLNLNGLTGILGITLGGCTTNNVINYLQKSGSLYPDSESFSYYAVPNAGHCWQLHYTAQSAFNNAHQWMSDHGF